MPIEFRCTSCNKLLRTPDDTSGKQAQCPACGQVLIVPSRGAAGVGMGGNAPPSGPPPSPPEGFANPYQSPSSPMAGARPAYAPAASGIITPTVIDLGDVFGRAWAIFKDQMGPCVVAVLILVGISVGLNLLCRFVIGTLALAVRRPEPIFTLSTVFALFTGLVQVWLGIGQTLFFLKIARGQKATPSDLFQGAPWFLPILGAAILFLLMYFGGLMLCIVPGIVLGLMFCQFWYLIVDRNVGVLESLSLSNRITDGNKLTLLGIFLLGILINLGGVAACCVGVLFTAPFVILTHVVAYLAMTGQPTAADIQYQAPSPAYPPAPGNTPFGSANAPPGGPMA